MSHQNLLVELGCEELPPKALDKLSKALFEGVMAGLEKAGIEFNKDQSRLFNSPRRLAFRLHQVADKQADQSLKRRGPAVAAAFDDEGKPTPAALGFARSVNLDISDIARTEDGKHLYVEVAKAGQSLSSVLYPILEDALKKLPIPKPMRWGNHQISFVRPVHWLVVMHGDEVIAGSLFEQAAGKQTRGHRTHAPGPHTIGHADDYEGLLEKAFVMVDPEARKARILEQTNSVAKAQGKRALIDSDLLNEVNNLVEWPVALSGSFDADFLEVPAEALISSMQSHQKFFPLLEDNDKQQLANQFITISNLESENPEAVRQGFERVIRPRLADARFFWDQDRKHGLESWKATLENVVFQKQLGSIADKSRRMAAISQHIADENGIDQTHAATAAALCKCDLMSEMVGEFPDLQGTMGRYYAQAAGEDNQVADAIEEHYQPRFASDKLPASPLGRTLALADRIDTLVGIFAIGQKPTGTKDPFGLRRAALGTVRILQFGAPDYSLSKLLANAANQLSQQLEVKPEVLVDAREFILERVRHHYQSESGYKAPLFNAVAAVEDDDLRDFDQRITALAAFMQRPEATALAGANKRIRNILQKVQKTGANDLGGEIIATAGVEQQLHQAITDMSDSVATLVVAKDYGSALDKLSTLRPLIDQFFEDVMVMDEDQAIRRSRLALVASVEKLFVQVADFSKLG
ncbi:MAG: glycine--tRNA ligase subunit beta [Xanthomonadales bacterium]|nr:glycine--tRNA ligase subunit beta [Xanthomonadales bacterium]